MKKIKRRIAYTSMIQEYGHKIFYGTKNFHQNHGNLIAASSTFYAILSSLPMILAIVTSIGIVSGDFSRAQNEVFNYVRVFFPNLAPWFFTTIKNIVAGQIDNRSYMNVLNWVLLTWAAMGFINSIFNGIHVLSGLKFHKKLIIPVKSFMVLIITILAAFLMIFLDSNIIHWMVVLLYFTFLFYFLMGKTIQLKDAFLGAFSFLILFFISKLLFGFYLKNIRLTLIRNFGDFYTLIVAVLWMYYIMNSFFLSASISLVRARPRVS